MIPRQTALEALNKHEKGKSQHLQYLSKSDRINNISTRKINYKNLAAGLPELLLLGTNCYLLLANLKFVTFVMTLPKIVVISLD